jgi:hypothetical protein
MYSVRGFRALFVACALAFTSLYCNPALAVLIVNDSWQDGTRTDPASPVYSENGVDSDADGNIASSAINMSTGHMVAVPGAGQ